MNIFYSETLGLVFSTQLRNWLIFLLLCWIESLIFKIMKRNGHYRIQCGADLWIVGQGSPSQSQATWG